MEWNKIRNWKEHFYVILWSLLKCFVCLSEWITCAKFCVLFAFPDTEMSTYQRREWKCIQYGEQRCRWGVFAVNSWDDQEREAHETSFEECPVTARLNWNVSWYISITKQKILQWGSRLNAADSSLSPCRSSLLTSCQQTGSERGGSSHGFKTFLAICHSATWARQPDLQPCATQTKSVSKRCVPGRARVPFLSALQNSHCAFFLCSLQFFITCESLVFSEGWKLKKKCTIHLLTAVCSVSASTMQVPRGH